MTISNDRRPAVRVKAVVSSDRRPLRTRLRYAFIHTYKPILDDAPYRSFETMAQYRAWCARELPAWLGYGPAV
jgi:hypothetical protein